MLSARIASRSPTWRSTGGAVGMGFAKGIEIAASRSCRRRDCSRLFVDNEKRGISA